MNGVPASLVQVAAVLAGPASDAPLVACGDVVAGLAAVDDGEVLEVAAGAVGGEAGVGGGFAGAGPPVEVAESNAANEAVVAVDANDFVLAACAFHPGVESGEWSIPALAVRLDLQGQKLGTTLLTSLLRDLSERTSGGFAHWKVERDNLHAHLLSQGIGAERDPAYPGEQRTLYFVGLDGRRPGR